MRILRAPGTDPGHTLVHICCAPDATSGVKRISGHFGRITGFFYNPNIWPREEYLVRLKETERLSAILPFDLIEGERDVGGFNRAIRGLESEPERGERCRACILLRLEESAKVALSLGIETFTTVLSVSPKKDAGMINECGRRIGEKHGLFFIELDLKKNDGFRESVALSKKYRLYRQNYCGCEYSAGR